MADEKPAPVPAAPSAAGKILPEESAKLVAFVAANCLDCHNKKDHIGDTVLEQYKDAESIRKDRKLWTRAMQLVQIGAMPPKDVDQPKKEDREAFVAHAKSVLNWVDPAHPDPGRVTARRLNRVEYRNTVRDLLGINFDPSSEFPPDDVGGGFDNNGDVLTLSPLVMEHYLQASQAIWERAMPEGGDWPTWQKIKQYLPGPGEPGVYIMTLLGREESRHLLPGQRITFTQEAVPSTQPRRPNAIKVEHKDPIPQEAEYIFRALAYRHAGGGLDVPTMVLEVDDKPLGEFKVDVNYGGQTFYAVKVRLTAGPHKVGVTWPLKKGETTPKMEFDPTGKTEPPGLHIRWTEIAGPRVLTPAEKTVLAHKEGAKPREAAREILERFAARAYRRPVTDADIDPLLKLFDAAEKDGIAFPESLRTPLQAVLVSPNFLFRIEKDANPEAEKQHPITEYQLASRLSYFLWSSMPDEELTALAAKNELTKNLEPQIRRMLASPKAQQLTENFASQWLMLRMLSKVTPDREKYPEYTDAMKTAMSTETLKFFSAVVNEDRSILDLLDGKFTYLNEPLAELYGIIDTKGNRKDQANPIPGGEPIKGDKFVRVELQDDERGGILTQASILTVTSNPGRTSPVKRGKFILEQILGEAPPPPPPNVPPLDNNAKAATTGNVRVRLEKHREDPACASCHLEMDQLGFAFEHFNPVGRFRSMDDEFKIDSSGELPNGAKFAGAAQLKAILKARSEEFTASLANKMMTYALGRQIHYYDNAAIDKITKATAADGYKFSRLVIEIVKSDPFVMRRGKDHVND